VIEEKLKSTEKMITKIIGSNHMVYKQNSIKSLTFEELPTILYLTPDSQPFISDVNGD